MQQTQDWEGLRALWRGVKQAGAILAMAVVGAICVGFTSGVVTLPVYGIGSWIGTPVGAGLGGWLGSRIAPRDAALVFVLAALFSWVAYAVAARQTDEGLIRFAAWGAGYVATSFVALRGGVHVPIKVRYPAAVVASWGFLLFVALWVVRHLWFPE